MELFSSTYSHTINNSTRLIILKFFMLFVAPYITHNSSWQSYPCWQPSLINNTFTARLSDWANRLVNIFVVMKLFAKVVQLLHIWYGRVLLKHSLLNEKKATRSYSCFSIWIFKNNLPSFIQIVLDYYVCVLLERKFEHKAQCLYHFYLFIILIIYDFDIHCYFYPLLWLPQKPEKL